MTTPRDPDQRDPVTGEPLTSEPAAVPPPAESTETRTYETVGTEPVPARGGPSGRWLVAGLATLLVLVAAIAVVWFATRSDDAAGGARYLPADTLAYADLRLDLPGDQRDKAADFLTHFPGFDDRAALEAKADDTFDRLVREASEQAYSYTEHIKPWFNGRITMGFALRDGAQGPDASATPTDSADASSGAGSALPEPEMLVVIGVKDRAEAQKVFDRLRADAEAKGTTFTSEDYRGTTIWTAQPPAAEEEPEASPSDMPFPVPDVGADRPASAFALTDDAILVSAGAEDLRAAIDRRDGQGGERLSDAQAFKDAQTSLGADQAGTVWVSGDRLRQLLADVAAETEGVPAVQQALRQIPDRILGSFRVESDRLVAEVRADLAEGAEIPEPRDSGLAGRVGADTAFFVEVPSLGEGMHDVVEQLKEDPSFEEGGGSEAVQQLEALLGAEMEDYLDWIGDAAIAGQMTTDVPSGGLIATVSDDETANQRLGQLGALLRLGGASAGGQIAVDTDERNGVEVTTVTVDAGAVGAPAEGEVGVSWAIKDDLFVLSPDLEFIDRVLAGPQGGTLAESPRFRDALTAVGGPATAGLTYVDITAIRQVVVEQLTPEDRDRYERDIEPYLVPFDIFIAASVAGGAEGETLGRSMLIVKQEE